jgi:hypothetical protein
MKLSKAQLLSLYYIVVFALLLFPISEASAVMLKVHKVKGNKAMILIEKGKTLNEGQVYQASPPGFGNNYQSQMGRQALRKNVFGGSGSISQFTTTFNGASSNTSNMNAEVLYGFVKPKQEYGFTFGYSYINGSGASDSQSLLLGGYFDFNLQPNNPMTPQLWSARVGLSIGTSDNSFQDSATSITKLTLGMVHKWFRWGDNVAITSQVGYQMQNIGDLSISGLAVSFGINNYF